MKLTELNVEDLNLYFAHTYARMNWQEVIKRPILLNDETAMQKVPVKTDFGSEWVLLREFCILSPHPKTGLPPTISTFLFLSVPNVGNVYLPMTDKLFSQQFPEVGMYDFRGSVVIYHRYPRRQNKKMICSDNSRFISFAKLMEEVPDFPVEIVGKHSFPNHKGSFGAGTLAEIFDSVPKQPDEIFDAVKKTKVIARVLNRRMCVSLGLRDQFPSVWLGRSYVGRMVKENRVEVEVAPLAQEVSDILRPMSIEVA